MLNWTGRIKIWQNTDAAIQWTAQKKNCGEVLEKNESKSEKKH